MESVDQIKAKIKLAKKKLEALQNMLDEKKKGASVDEIEEEIRQDLDKIIEDKITKEQGVEREELMDEQELLAQWFDKRLGARMLALINRMFSKGFRVSRIVKAFKNVLAGNDYYEHMYDWLNEYKASLIKGALISKLREGVETA
jgi:hypothetical protein